MRIESQKLNAVLDLDEDQVIRFPHGLIGFADETEFVLLEREQSPRIGWLQSVKSPDLAIPVVSGHELAEEYPDVPLEEAIFSERMDPVNPDTAVMVVLTCQLGMVPTVNMTSPLVVDSRRRTGTQVILRGSRFATRELLSLRPDPPSQASTIHDPGDVP